MSLEDIQKPNSKPKKFIVSKIDNFNKLKFYRKGTSFHYTMKTIQLPPNNYVITYYQTFEEVTWLLRQENWIKYLIFKKIENCEFD